MDFKKILDESFERSNELDDLISMINEYKAEDDLKRRKDIHEMIDAKKERVKLLREQISVLKKREKSRERKKENHRKYILAGALIEDARKNKKTMELLESLVSGLKIKEHKEAFSEINIREWISNQ